MYILKWYSIYWSFLENVYNISNQLWHIIVNENKKMDNRSRKIHDSCWMHICKHKCLDLDVSQYKCSSHFLFGRFFIYNITYIYVKNYNLYYRIHAILCPNFQNLSYHVSLSCHICIGLSMSVLHSLWSMFSTFFLRIKACFFSEDGRMEKMTFSLYLICLSYLFFFLFFFFIDSKSYSSTKFYLLIVFLK